MNWSQCRGLIALVKCAGLPSRWTQSRRRSPVACLELGVLQIGPHITEVACPLHVLSYLWAVFSYIHILTASQPSIGLWLWSHIEGIRGSWVIGLCSCTCCILEDWGFKNFVISIICIFEFICLSGSFLCFSCNSETVSNRKSLTHQAIFLLSSISCYTYGIKSIILIYSNIWSA